MCMESVSLFQMEETAMSRLECVAWKGLLLGLIVVSGSRRECFAAEKSAPELQWLTDYSQAMEQAKTERKTLLILFQRSDFNSVPDAYERQYLPAQADLLQSYVLVKIPTNGTISMGGKPLQLLSHAAFREMHGSPGIAMVDLAHPKAAYYGYVVSVFPFQRGKYYDFKPQHLPVALSLPAGSLSQRSMVYAVRVHPERPGSTTSGDLNPVLADEANKQSNYQAAINVQGHHNWDSRFGRILSRLLSLGGRRPTEYPVEVVAESWPGQDLMDSCVDCVASWRQSPGHWSAVQARQASYGYDIRQGSNGIWYATGIFAN